MVLRHCRRVAVDVLHEAVVRRSRQRHIPAGRHARFHEMFPALVLEEGAVELLVFFPGRIMIAIFCLRVILLLPFAHHLLLAVVPRGVESLLNGIEVGSRRLPELQPAVVVLAEGNDGKAEAKQGKPFLSGAERSGFFHRSKVLSGIKVGKNFGEKPERKASIAILDK